MPLMPWQQHVLDVALEIDARTGKLAYRDVTLTVPRQSGKTTLVLVLILLRALGAPRQQIRYTAQTGADARKKWMDDWLPILEPSSFNRFFRARLTNGHEALLFKNGSHQGLVATTKKTGHGGTIDLGILDEAFAHADARLEQALKPAMITRPQPQLWVISTAGTPDDSPYLWGKVETGRELSEQGVNSGVAYFEWSAEEDRDPADPETWWSCMPALGHTVTDEAVAADFGSMELNEFERAYLNRWKTASHDPVIPLVHWMALVDRSSEAVDPVAFAFDVAPDRSTAAISVAGVRSDGLMHVEVVDHRRGTQWVAPRLVELVAKHECIGVWCDTAGPAAALLSAMEREGVDVTTIGAQEHARACGVLFDAVVDESVRHRGDPELIHALEGAAIRTLTDAWAWRRTASNADICPLVAATLALWGATSAASEFATVLYGSDSASTTEDPEIGPAYHQVGVGEPRVITQEESTSCFACRVGGCTIHSGGS